MPASRFYLSEMLDRITSTLVEAGLSDRDAVQAAYERNVSIAEFAPPDLQEQCKELEQMLERGYHTPFTEESARRFGDLVVAIMNENARAMGAEETP